jgi:SAM-dependent methyltransferase
MKSAAVGDLSEEQLEPFDADFRDWPKYLEVLHRLLDHGIPSTLLDIGGGNGRFLDHVLTAFPRCEGVLVDNSQYMLAKNIEHARKRLVLGSALEVDKVAAPESCDLITFNLILHHLVGPSYDSTHKSVMRALRDASLLLRPQGHMIVYEQVYDGLVDAIEPGAIIFALTRLQIPLVTATLRRMGANTAGVGVCFRSSMSWTALFRAAGLRLLEQRPVHRDSPPLIRKAAFLVRQVGTHIFVLAKQASTRPA